jgi:hypothetical protein
MNRMVFGGILSIKRKIMKKETVLYLFFLSILVTGCSSDKQSYEDLPYIDVRKDYPEKEINLTDIADVTYLHLSTASDDFLYKGKIDCVTQNTIVVIDRSSHSVLFFSKDGTPKSRFNRKGQGPEEYAGVEFTMYDEEKDDVYILPGIFNTGSRYINVYSSSGEYKRKLTLPQAGHDNQMVFFDDRSILVYDNSKMWQNIRKKYSEDKTAFSEPVDSTFFLISKTDGTVLEYINLPGNNIDISFITNLERTFFGQISYARVRKCPDGLFLYNPETDTVFLYSKNKSLIPYMCKKPLLSDLDPVIAMDICMDAGRFQVMSVIPYLANKTSSARYYMRDKKTGEIFRQKIILPDYKGKDFYFDPRRTGYYEKAYHFELDLIELKEAYRENRLSGKLKELVATLNKDGDNNVFMPVDFK